MRLLIILILLTGCCTTPGPTLPEPVDQQSPATGKVVDSVKTFIDLDERLLELCDQLPLLERRVYSMDDLLKHKAKEVEVYSACASRHKSLSELMRKYLNVQHAKSD